MSKNLLFREKFTQTIIDFYSYFQVEKDVEMQIFFLFVLSGIYSVSAEIKQPFSITIESLKSRLKELKKDLIGDDQQMVLCIEASLLKHVNENEFSLSDLEILIQASCSITDLRKHTILREVITPQISSIKSQIEHRVKSLLETLSEDELTAFVNRCYFSHFKEVGHKWSFDSKTFTFHSKEGDFFISYYTNFQYRALKNALRGSSIKLEDLRFNAGCFEDHSGIRFYLRGEGIQTRLFLDGAHLKHEYGYAIPSDKLEKVTREHGEIRYPGIFPHKDGTTLIQHVVFDDGHIEKVISSEGVIQKYDTLERKVIEGSYCKGITLSQDSFFPYIDKFGSKFWQDEAGGKTYLEFTKLKKIFILQKGAFFEISDERAELLEPCPLLFSGFTDYLYLQHEKLKKAVIEINENTICELKINDDLDFMIEKESDKAALALVFFNAHDFIKAYQWVQRCQTVGKMDPFVCDILKAILRAQTNHPDALTCKVKIASLLWQNEILYRPYLDFDLKKQIYRVYKEYISQAGHGELKPLSLEEEQILFIKSDLDPEIIDLRKAFFQKGNQSYLQQPHAKQQPLRNPFIQDLQFLDKKPNFKYEVLLDPKCKDQLDFPYFLAIALDISTKKNLDLIQKVLLVKKLGTYKEKEIAQLLQNLLSQQATFSFTYGGSKELSINEADEIISRALVPSITPSLSLPVDSYSRAKKALPSTELHPRSLFHESFPLTFTPATDLFIPPKKADLKQKQEIFKKEKSRAQNKN